ncbi:hypothetical protein ACFVMC_29140 [Nocardia sp. NPDC127579]
MSGTVVEGEDGAEGGAEDGTTAGAGSGIPVRTGIGAVEAAARVSLESSG